MGFSNIPCFVPLFHHIQKAKQGEMDVDDLLSSLTSARFANDQRHGENSPDTREQGITSNPLQEQPSRHSSQLRGWLTNRGYGGNDQCIKINVVKPNECHILAYFNIHLAERLDNPDRGGVICSEQSVRTIA